MTTTKTPTEFDCDGVAKVAKGRMVLLYATVDGEQVHVASFFHENKADWVLHALKETYGVTTAAPKPKKEKIVATKKAVKKLKKKN